MMNFSPLLFLFKRIGIAFLIFSLCRFLFYLFHLHLFSGNFPFSAFSHGIRFDWVAISYLLSPFIMFSIIPLSVGLKQSKFYKNILKYLFLIGISLGIVFNLIDLGYYQYSLKRTTADIFTFLGTGNDVWKLLPKYIVDFWYAFLFLAILIYLSHFLYKKSSSNSTENYKNKKQFYLSNLLLIVVTLLFTILGFRGGTQLKPLDIINAANYTTPKYVPIVLNTPFCIIKTVLNEEVSRITFFTDTKELENIYSPEISINGSGIFKDKNVVLIILESFAKEYVGYLNNGTGFTPFLDSLSTKSYIFTNAYASGTRSIEALPSIYAGIPNLTNTPFIISNFSSNHIDALPQILKNQGYQTSFYHGGANGTMGFNGFAKISGIENYYGLDEYPNAYIDYDGNWGIFDEPYLQYFAKDLTSKKEPFFSTVFTLSSHHPYKIPKEFEDRFLEGNLPIHKTIRYTDYALHQFFNTAKNQAWFNNTIFLITADHSSHSIDPENTTIIGNLAIPVLVFDPSQNLQGINNEYFQQLDITPTLLYWFGINANIISFGNDVSQKEKYLIGFTRNTFYYLENNYLLLFDGEKSIAFYYYTEDKLLLNNLLNSKMHLKVQMQFETKLKAIMQQYNNRLIDNNLSFLK